MNVELSVDPLFTIIKLIFFSKFNLLIKFNNLGIFFFSLCGVHQNGAAFFKKTGAQKTP